MVFLIPLGPLYLKKIQTNCTLNPDFQPIGSLPEVYRLQNTSSGFCRSFVRKKHCTYGKTVKCPHTRGKQSCLCECSANNRSGRNVQIT